MLMLARKRLTVDVVVNTTTCAKMHRQGNNAAHAMIAVVVQDWHEKNDTTKGKQE